MTREQADSLASDLWLAGEEWASCVSAGCAFDSPCSACRERNGRIADLILRIDGEARLETAREIAGEIESYTFELAPGNTIRCGFAWAERIRKAYPAAFTEEPKV
jgi:hypothetical protein